MPGIVGSFIRRLLPRYVGRWKNCYQPLDVYADTSLLQPSGRDTHIMLFKVPIMICSKSQYQANYGHCFVPIMLSISLNF